jgi:hypothetical protein
MRSLAALTLVLAACGTPSASDAGADAGAIDAGPTLTAEQREWVTAHDAVRANAAPTPSPALAPVEWSASAAAQAADWAARCTFMHRNPNSLGENIFASSASRTPTQVVNSWGSEKSNYTLATNTCAVGRECGHYTQIVWRSSVGIGCATQACTTGSPFGSGTWFFSVCNYAPAGNVVGQKPY